MYIFINIYSENACECMFLIQLFKANSFKKKKNQAANFNSLGATTLRRFEKKSFKKCRKFVNKC